MLIAPLHCADRVLDLREPVLMGVVNVTPDSFSDGGRFVTVDAAQAQAEHLIAEGAAIIDVGGESTRPGATPVDSEEELRRVLPVVERLAARTAALISIDTSNPELMRRAAGAGAHLINDVRALRRPGALEAVAASTLGVCLMHMRGEPQDMQADPRYDDVVAEVKTYLAERVAACVAAGIARERLCIDPGFCFGKTLAHNVALLRGLPQFVPLALPLLVGLSRKSLVAGLLGASSAQLPASARVNGSVTLAAMAVSQGAHIVRTHDVAATREALRIVRAIWPLGER